MLQESIHPISSHRYVRAPFFGSYVEREGLLPVEQGHLGGGIRGRGSGEV